MKMNQRYLFITVFLIITCIGPSSTVFSQEIGINQNHNVAAIHGRVWGPDNVPAVKAHVLVTDTEIKTLYGEAITISNPGPDDCSYQVTGLPVGRKLLVFAFHRKLPGIVEVREFNLKKNELKELKLTINLNFTDPEFVTSAQTRSLRKFEDLAKFISKISIILKSSKHHFSAMYTIDMLKKFVSLNVKFKFPNERSKLAVTPRKKVGSASNTILMNVGEVVLKVPIPNEYKRVVRNSELRKLLELISPENSEPVEGFISNKDFDQYSINNDHELENYIIIHSDKRLIDVHLTQAEFQTLSNQMRNGQRELIKKWEDFATNHFRDLNEILSDNNSDFQLKYGGMIPLGVFNDRERSISMAIIISSSSETSGITAYNKVICTTTMMLIKNRIMSFKIFQSLRNQEDIENCKHLTTTWLTQIQEANSEPTTTYAHEERKTQRALPSLYTFETVRIGNQVWRARNLDVDHYRNGDPIPQVQDPDEWVNLSTGAWCYYDNDPANGKVYGRLYNWYAVNDPRGLAPEGWHVPTDGEWKELEIYLGMSRAEANIEGTRGSIAGGKLKETGTTHWVSPNIGASNEVGFFALPVGYRNHLSGNFYKLGQCTAFWTATELKSNYAWYRALDYNLSHISRYNSHEEIGFSVRLVKEN